MLFTFSTYLFETCYSILNDCKTKYDERHDFEDKCCEIICSVTKVGQSHNQNQHNRNQNCLKIVTKSRVALKCLIINLSLTLSNLSLTKSQMHIEYSTQKLYFLNCKILKDLILDNNESSPQVSKMITATYNILHLVQSNNCSSLRKYASNCNIMSEKFLNLLLSAIQFYAMAFTANNNSNFTSKKS